MRSLNTGGGGGKQCFLPALIITAGRGGDSDPQMHSDYCPPQRPPERNTSVEQSGHSGLQWLVSYGGSDVPQERVTG